MSKKNIPIDFLVMSSMGDAILNRVTKDIVDEFCVGSPSHKATIHGKIKSNSFIKDWPGFKNVKFLHESLFVGNTAKAVAIQGDLVEAYIAFLYLNLGYPAAERYIRNNIIKTIKQIV